METVIIVLDMLSRLGQLVADLIYKQPNSEELRAEAQARLQKLQDILANDKFAKDLQAQLDAAVPPASFPGG